MFISISFAGSRRHPNLDKLKISIDNFFIKMENTLLAKYERSLNFHINLLNGLADGADMECADAFIQWQPKCGITKTITGVFPFPIVDYLQTISDKKRFENLLKKLNNIVVLDGLYVPDRTKVSCKRSPKECRVKAYRQQADYLLLSSDILFVAADRNIPRREGGTMETVDKALNADLPVVFLNLNNMNFDFLWFKEEISRKACHKDNGIWHELNKLFSMLEAQY